MIARLHYSAGSAGQEGVGMLLNVGRVHVHELYCTDKKTTDANAVESLVHVRKCSRSIREMQR